MAKFDKINSRISRAKPVRVEWSRRPVTKVKPSKKLYSRKGKDKYYE